MRIRRTVTTLAAALAALMAMSSSAFANPVDDAVRFVLGTMGA